MARQTFRIVREPGGSLLKAILDEGSRQCDVFLFALTGMGLSARAEQLLTDLDPYLLQCTDTNEYPAGTLPWGTIRVCSYSLSEGSLELLQAAAACLYDWQEPDLPSDLCLMRDGQPWLVTMASDRESVLVLEAEEAAALCAQIPDLVLRPTPSEVGGSVQ